MGRLTVTWLLGTRNCSLTKVSHFGVCIALLFFAGPPSGLASPDSWCHSVLHLNCPLYRVLLGRCVPLVRSTHHAHLVHCLHLDHEGEPPSDEVSGLGRVLVVQVSTQSIKAVIFSPPLWFNKWNKHCILILAAFAVCSHTEVVVNIISILFKQSNRTPRCS